jgi:hypothetical protein
MNNFVNKTMDRTNGSPLPKTAMLNRIEHRCVHQHDVDYAPPRSPAYKSLPPSWSPSGCRWSKASARKDGRIIAYDAMWKGDIAIAIPRRSR